MCLTGVDYFSTLGYQPGIAALAAGAISPFATLVLVLVTLFGALPMYRRVAEESPHGDGSISMLERLLRRWQSKLLVLVLLGFVATGFIITITLSAADAAAHIVENPFARQYVEGGNVVITLVLIALLGAVFLKGFKEAIGIAVALVALYLSLNVVVIGQGLLGVINDPALLSGWTARISQGFSSPLAVIGAALLVFPRLALGLSGFETGVVVMPLVKGDPGDTEERPAGRIRSAKRLLTTAALVMSVLLIGSSFATTLLVPQREFWPTTSASVVVPRADLERGAARVTVPLDGERLETTLTVPAGVRDGTTFTANTPGGAVPFEVAVANASADGSRVRVTVTKRSGEANGRALAYLAHQRFGDVFGTLYDVSTILILWFAGASAMAGLLNIVPRYLPRYGMAPDWARATRPLVLIYTFVCFFETLIFRADVNAQAAAYATGVLVLMGSASVAVTLSAVRHRQRLLMFGFGFVSLIFGYTLAVTFAQDLSGLRIGLSFIGAIVAVSIVSRVLRSTELRAERVELDANARRFLNEAAAAGSLRFIANQLDAGDAAEYSEKERDVRAETHLPSGEPFLFLEVTVADPSEFSDVLEVRGVEVAGYRILRVESSAVPNAIAAFLLWARDTYGELPHVYFQWIEGSPVLAAARFLVLGEGDIAPLTHEILRRAVRSAELRPVVHVGG
nr:APC family permease [Deinococcus pimensis]